MNDLKFQKRYVAFRGSKRIAAGDIERVAEKVKKIFDGDPEAGILVFDNATSETIELDLRGTMKEVLKKLPRKEEEAVGGDELTPRGPGRPKLGVVAREVTLLPRHWDWLAKQPGGASVALRKLVEAARYTYAEADALRDARDSAYRFMSVMAGNLPGFEEATRALFAGNQPQFNAMVASWPTDIRNHAKELAALTFRS